MIGLLAAAVVGGLAAIDRKALLQLQLSRPIVLGPLVGWALGDPLGALYVCAPLELLWIGAANLGAALPPHETAASAAIAASAVAAAPGAVDGAVAALSFVLFAPVSLVGRRLEALGERGNEHLVARASILIGEGMSERALRLHLAGVWRPFLATAALVVVAAAAAGPLLARVRADLPAWIADGLADGWALVWAAGAASTVRAARLPNGLVLALAGAAGAAALWLGGRLG